MGNLQSLLPQDLQGVTNHPAYVLTKLVISTVTPLLDTGSDVWVTIEWLTAEDPDLNHYGKISLAILGFSVAAPALFYFLLEVLNYPKSFFNIRPPCYEDGFFHPVLGCCLSLLDMRMPCRACITGAAICSGGVDQAHTELENNPADFAIGMSSIMYLKLFELLGESTFELLLQGYVAGYRDLKYGEKPSSLLVISITLGLLTIAHGIAESFFREDKLVVRICAMAYLAAIMTVRLSLHAVFFAKFGWLTCVAITIAWLLRVSHYLQYTSHNNLPLCIRVVGMFIDSPLTYFVPLGSDNYIGTAEALALGGAANEPEVSDKLFSNNALLMLATHAIEAIIGWIFVMAFPKLQNRLDIPLSYCLVWGVAPSFAAMSLFALTYWLANRSTDKVTTYEAGDVECIGSRIS